MKVFEAIYTKMYNDDILLLLLLQNKRYEIIENILIDIDLN